MPVFEGGDQRPEGRSAPGGVHPLQQVGGKTGYAVP